MTTGPNVSSPRLRIGVAAHKLGREGTSADRVVSNLIMALRDVCDHDLVLYLTDPEATERWRSRGYFRTTVRLLRPSHPLVRLPLALPLAAARDNLDVLLAHVHRPPASPCPVVCLVNDVSFARMPQYFSRLERTYMNRTIPASMRRSQALVAISEFTRDEIVRVYDIPASRITVAPCAADPMFFDSTRRRSAVAPPFFLSIGNLQPRKNLITLIRAYQQLIEQHPSVPERLVIVGKNGFQAEQVHRVAEELHAAGKVVFTGHVDDQSLIGLLQHATAFAYPSVYEGFGLPPLEAMAMGVPVVVADIPVMREVVGNAALRLPATSKRAWAETLRKLSSERALAQRLSVRGRERAAEFTWEASARSVLTTLEGVVKAS